jgi:porphobilinogen synthase
MSTVPAQSFSAPARAEVIAAARFMPSVCGVLGSSSCAWTIRTPLSRQDAAVMEGEYAHITRSQALMLPATVSTLVGVPFPATRLRRLRATPVLRDLVRETRLDAADLVLPLFVQSGSGGRSPIPSMPGVDRLSISAAVEEAGEVLAAGLPAILLFGIPEHKDAEGSGAYDDEGIVQLSTRAIKEAHPDLLVMTDVCLCEYTDHGHCGLIGAGGGVENDASAELIARTAVSHARAGADVVAPSDMMDGRIGAVRRALDDEGFSATPIVAYSAKFASAFYGPFREAADSTPAFGDRRAYQMDPANGDEAVREALLDVQEGADIVMVKPALAYLDVIRRVKDETKLPVAAYNVSGEYAMVKAAAGAGGLDERAAVLEILTSIRRAGADIIITYHAKDAAAWL